MVTAIVLLSILVVVLLSAIVVILTKYIRLVRQLQADCDHWKTLYENLHASMEPMISYLTYCKRNGVEINDASCRAYFAATGQNYDYWIAQYIKQHPMPVRRWK
jgi:hypothetical protein